MAWKSLPFPVPARFAGLARGQACEAPGVVLLHGGPGFDHTSYKPSFAHLSDIAQVILYFDHRGNGHSSGNDPGTWNLAQWGDDVKSFCDSLGIEKPIV